MFSVSGSVQSSCSLIYMYAFIRIAASCGTEDVWRYWRLFGRKLDWPCKYPIGGVDLCLQTVTWDGFLWGLKSFNQCCLGMRWWFPRPLNSFSSWYSINFLVASLKLLTNFENAYWNPPQNSLHCDWSMFSSVDPTLAAVKIRQNQLSQPSLGIILEHQRRLPVWIKRVKMAAVWFWRGFEMILKICFKFQRSKPKFLYYFFHRAILKPMSEYLIILVRQSRWCSGVWVPLEDLFQLIYWL